MKELMKKYPEEAKALRQSSLLIKISLVMLIAIPLMIFMNVLNSYAYFSFFIFSYILKKQCREYAAIQDCMKLMEELEKEG